MATIFDVAKYILHKKKDSLSTWKLEKLCYYSQAWALAWTAQPIFDEDFEAWVNGPVCPELFHEHQGKFYITYSGLKKGDETNLTDDEKETIDIVLNHYGDMEPYQLRELSHSEDPWKNARGNLPPDRNCDTVITKESMGEFYGGL